MRPRDVKTIEEARHLVESSDIKHVKVGLFDIDGVMRGKYMSRQKFMSALDKGFGFCDVVVGWDSDDQLYDNVSYTGWHTGYPDAPARIVPDSCRSIPFEPGYFFFLAEFDGPAMAICPRAALRRAIEKAQSMGFNPFAALEFEFFMFDETPHSVREKGYQNLTPITPGNFGYSMLRNSVYAEFYHQLLEMSEEMDFPLEGVHTETGPGVLEAAIAVDTALAAADKAALFKTFTKILAQRNGMMATFMAKWSPKYPGQSGHIHISLQDQDGQSVFYDPNEAYQMSAKMRSFVAGCQAMLPELLCMVSPTVNSFSRMVPGAWAPTTATWGVENRTVALRVIPGSAKSQRVEFRSGAADVNPYLGLAAALVSGLHGIEQNLKLGQPIEGNAYDQPVDPKTALPTSLTEAAGRLRQSQVARDVFGDAFVEHFAATREWEEREFRKAITDWELKRYFEII